MRVKADKDGKQLLVDVAFDSGVVLEFVWTPENDGEWEFWQTKIGAQHLGGYNRDLTGTVLGESEFRDALDAATADERNGMLP